VRAASEVFITEAVLIEIGNLLHETQQFITSPRSSHVPLFDSLRFHPV